VQQGAQRLVESKGEVQIVRDRNDQVFCPISFLHEGTDDVMTMLVLRFLCLQLERDIQSIRERNTEVCDIV
jgi:hypothetical protein